MSQTAGRQGFLHLWPAGPQDRLPYIITLEVVMLKCYLTTPPLSLSCLPPLPLLLFSPSPRAWSVLGKHSVYTEL